MFTVNDIAALFPLKSNSLLEIVPTGENARSLSALVVFTKGIEEPESVFTSSAKSPGDNAWVSRV
jgi:hypothetical protein